MKNKHAFILFAAGLLGVIGGAGSFYVEQRLGPVAAGACLFGLGFLFMAWLGQGRSVSRRSALLPWKRAGIIFLAVSFLAGIFVAVNLLALRLPWRWDVTRARQHTLTPGTLKALEGLGQDVKFSALYVGIPPTYLEDLFREYARASGGKVTTEIIDPIDQIGYAAQFGNVISSKQNKVVVRSGKERRDVDFTDKPLSEDQLTNAIMRVTRPARQACFLAGHGEYSTADKEDQGLMKLAKSLEANNISSRDVMLGVEGGVPQDCDVLVVAGPHEELTAREEAAVGAYLQQGGDALFLVENVVVTTPDKPLTADQLRKNPSLNRILNPWGVNVGDDIAIDLVSHAGDDVGCPATRNYVKHPAITEGLDYTFYVRPRSLTLLKDRRPSIKAAPIVMTASKDKSWAETDRTLRVRYDPGVDLPGPVTMGYVLMEEKSAPARSDTRIIVFTDADFLTNIYIDQYSNARMGLNAVSWLAESEGSVFVDARDVKVERLDLTSRQRRMVAFILFLMPVLIAAGGGMVWMRRR